MICEIAAIDRASPWSAGLVVRAGGAVSSPAGPLEALQLASIDIETRHKAADAILCSILTAYGLDSVVAEYDAIIWLDAR